MNSLPQRPFAGTSVIGARAVSKEANDNDRVLTITLNNSDASVDSSINTTLFFVLNEGFSADLLSVRLDPHNDIYVTFSNEESGADPEKWIVKTILSDVTVPSESESGASSQSLFSKHISPAIYSVKKPFKEKKESKKPLCTDDGLLFAGAIATVCTLGALAYAILNRKK